MKILKENKSLSHNHLHTILFERLKFPIDAAFIKTRIESLIDKDYIKRKADDSSILEYIAWYYFKN